MDDGNEYLRKWRIQKKNEAQDFVYTFPKLPAFFRVQRAVNRGLILLERLSEAVCILGLIVFGISLDLFDIDQPFLETIISLSIFMAIICIILRVIQGFTWRCPYCGKGFPYYGVGRARELKRVEVFQQMKCLGGYDELRFCSLILPGVCPNCKKKFYIK